MTKTEFETLPKGWANVQLDDLVFNPKADLVDGPFGSNLKSSEYVESGIPVLKIQNIKANRFVRKRFSYVTPMKAAELSRHSFLAGDLMVTKLGEPLGLCCEVPPDFEHGIFVADLMRLRPSPKIVNSAFLLHAINSVVVQNQFKVITKGTTRQRVNLTIVRSIKIALPPLSEQHRIVAKIEELFSELDKGIENLKTARAQLKVYRQALLKHAFEGKLTAQWREQNRDQLETTAALQKRIQQERAQRYQQQLADWQTNGGSKPKAPKPLPPLTKEELAELPELPEGWGWEKNENYLFEIKDGTHDTPKYVDNGIPFVTQKNIKNGKLSMGNVTYISTDDHEKFFKRSNVQKGDLIISMIGHGRGECCLVDVDTIFSIKNLGLFKFFSRLQSSGFLKFYFQSTGGLNLALSKSKGGAQPFIGLTELRDWPVPVCALDEQYKILEKIESRLSVIDQLELTITTALQQAEVLRQSILKRAFSGQLVPQDPHDEPASVLLARIRAERATVAKNSTVAAKPRKTAGRK